MNVKKEGLAGKTRMSSLLVSNFIAGRLPENSRTSLEGGLQSQKR